MKKNLAAVLVISLLAFSIVGCSQDTSSASSDAASSDASESDAVESDAASDVNSDDPIIIGCETSLTGEKALTGEYMKNALDLAVERINANGGLLGREVQVIIEDDQGTDQGAVNAYNKLASSGVCAVIGNLYSTMNVAISGEVEKAQIPTVVTGSSVSVSELNNPYLFQARTNDDVAVRAIINTAVNDMGFEKIAIIHDSDAYGQGAYEVAVSTLEEMGMEPVVVTTYNSGDKDFTAHISQIQHSDADVIIAFGLQTEAGLIMKQLDVMDNQLPIIGSTSYASAIAIELAGDAANGVYSVVDYVPTTPLETGQEFAKLYRDKYGIESDWSGAAAWDSFLIITEAINRAGTTDADAICEEISNLKDFEGASNIFTFDERHVGGTMNVFVQIEDQVPEVFGTASAR